MSSAANTAGDYDVFWSRLQESAQYHPANRFRYWLIAGSLRKYMRQGMSVLDMGCGRASLLLRLRSDFSQGHFVGCDVSDHVIRQDRSDHPEITFFQADVTAADFVQKAQSGSRLRAFDIVISSEVIEHVENDEGLLRNAAALLAPGGYVILTTQSGPRYRLDRELLHHLRHYERSTLEKMATSAGLEIVEAFNCGFPILTMQKIVADAMFDTVMRSAASSGRPPLLVRMIMRVMYDLMRITPKWFGPQIVIVARRPLASNPNT